MKKYRVGYTQGVFDMFHVGHLNLLKKAKERCDFLIVGVNSDELVETYKHKCPMINENQRKQIVEAIKYVDKCAIVDTLDKEIAWENFKFDAIFIGDDWKGNERWVKTEKLLSLHNVKVIYLEYTKGISSTILKEKLEKDIKL